MHSKAPGPAARQLPVLTAAALVHGAPGERDASRRLTVREREVLTLVASGASGLEIAEALKIAPATVETHVRHCLGKLDAKNRPHAIALALGNGEITAPPELVGE